MDKDEVAQLIADLRRFGLEATATEAKSSRTELPKSLKETLSAFSNTPGGGTVILGLAEGDEFLVVGVDDPKKIQSDLASQCRTEIHPPLQPRIDVFQVEGKAVVAAEIPELPPTQKPAYCNSLGMQRGSFMRIGEGDRRLTPEEVQQLVADRGQPLFDTEVVQEAAIDDLAPQIIDRYVERLRQSSTRAFVDADTQSILRMTRVLGKSSDGTYRPTIAGLLAFAHYPQQYLPQLNITFVHYPSKDGQPSSQGVRFIDNASINGPIPEMVDEVLRVISRNMTRRAMITGHGRRDIWEYPPEALREAIANALVHRDLSPGSRGQQVQVEMYPDRLVVKNSGGLFGSVSLTQLGEEGVSSSRNAALMRILEDVPLASDDRTVCENRGSGIRTMQLALRSAGMGMPEFRDRVTAFELRLPNHSLLDESALEWLSALGREGLRDSQCTALALMRRGEIFDNSKYRAATGISDSRTATFELQDLVARELIEQHGNRNGARYTLSEYATHADRLDGKRRGRPDRHSQIIDTLSLHGELSKTEIAKYLNVSPKTAEHWLRRLKADGLVTPTSTIRGDKHNRYRLSEQGKQGSLFTDQ